MNLPNMICKTGQRILEKQDGPNSRKLSTTFRFSFPSEKRRFVSLYRVYVEWQRDPQEPGCKTGKQGMMSPGHWARQRAGCPGAAGPSPCPAPPLALQSYVFTGQWPDWRRLPPPYMWWKVCSLPVSPGNHVVLCLPLGLVNNHPRLGRL